MRAGLLYTLCVMFAGTTLARGSGGGRKVPRAMVIYRDPATNVDTLFLLLGQPGVITGVLDAKSVPPSIVWANAPEFPAPGQPPFPTRPLGMYVFF